MIQKIKIKFLKNIEITILSLLIFLTIVSTSYYNYSKKKILSNYRDTVNNVYLKKTIDNPHLKHLTIQSCGFDCQSLSSLSTMITYISNIYVMLL